MQYIFGPVPSRRLGLSLGISPIPKKTCNFSCIYCQLGRTNHLTNTRKEYFPVGEVIAELDTVLSRNPDYDVVTVVGEGEPTLYSGLGRLIELVKARTDKPVAVITNGALVYDPDVQGDLGKADIVLLSMDAYDPASLKEINRPFGTINYSDMYRGLQDFAERYQGQLWLEIMLMKDINDSDAALEKYARLLKELKYDRLYLNTPVRPPAEEHVEVIDNSRMQRAVELLGGISIDLLVSQGFHSEIADDYQAILSIIRRHPMNGFEIQSFLDSRGCADAEGIIDRLKKDEEVSVLDYKGYLTFRVS